jgi:hypothetical protein
MMENHTFVTESSAELVTENLFSLTDPWRDRFLAFVAERALGKGWNGRLPTKKEVTAWLCKESLCQAVTLLLNTWQGDPDIAGNLN